ncbi:hypothetical protein ACTJKC_21435 [Pedobacter sp. 22226]|uniref:hypothetical protein n=1 Tax=Pedobacter sp. 22226 TaxID=3453894 RepID=UPI003F849487
MTYKIDFLPCCTTSARRRRRALSFWHQKETKPRLAELINANKKDKQLINKMPAEIFFLGSPCFGLSFLRNT